MTKEKLSLISTLRFISSYLVNLSLSAISVEKGCKVRLILRQRSVSDKGWKSLVKTYRISLQRYKKRNRVFPWFIFKHTANTTFENPNLSKLSTEALIKHRISSRGNTPWFEHRSCTCAKHTSFNYPDTFDSFLSLIIYAFWCNHFDSEVTIGQDDASIPNVLSYALAIILLELLAFLKIILSLPTLFLSFIRASTHT